MIDDPAMLVIFDVDGTIVNLNDAIDFDALLIEAFSIYGVKHPPRSARDTLWRAGKDHATLLASWGVDDPRVFWDVFDRLDFETRSSAIAAGRINLYPDSKPALAALHETREVVLAVHTNTPVKLARYQLEHFDLAKYFDTILALDIEGYDQSRAKPEPWGIHHLQATIGAARGKDFTTSTAFVGDSRIDMDAARGASVPGILVSREPQGGGKGEFDMVTSLEQVTAASLVSVIRRFNEALMP